MFARKNKSDILLSIFCVTFITVFALLCLYPFLLVVTSSFTDELVLVREGYRLIPSKWSIDAYSLLFKTNTVWNAYMVTIFVTVVGTVLSMLVTSGISYAISVKTFRCRNAIALFVYFTMLFNGGLVPTYILITKYLHMTDSIWVLIIPSLVNPWNMFLLRNFFRAIPDSLSESAKLDGANDILILFKIILPLSLPAIASISLFYALAYWNEWFKAMLYIRSEIKYPLQYLIMSIIRNMNFANSMAANVDIKNTIPAYTIRMATTVVTIGPIILLYPFLQKYFVKGLTVGGVKG